MISTFDDLLVLSEDDLKSNALELGVDVDLSKEELIDKIAEELGLVIGDHDDSTGVSGSAAKKQVRKRRKKKRNQNGSVAQQRVVSESTDREEETGDEVEIELVPAEDFGTNPVFEQFAEVFAKFEPVEEEEEGEGEGEDQRVQEGQGEEDMDLEDEDSEEEQGEKLSRKKMRRLNRMSVAELKQQVKKPDVVEWVDCSAADPKLLVHLKGYRNAVPIPEHWSQKRKYLQGKRGYMKKPFELPDFIRATGIMEMRDTQAGTDPKLKSRTRERLQPKMGKLDIDYQRLYDAFFKHQTKPRLTTHGDLYYEGKEFEAKMQKKKPGELSLELRAALNMPPLAPPPWLINMQRYGPPPSYPNLKIPGLNAPIPQGAQWGYHPGGWGKPAVDEFNRPLYGDVFGVYVQPSQVQKNEAVNRELWGELEPEAPDYEEEEEEEEQGEEDQDEMQREEPARDGFASVSGLETPSQVFTSGMETPDHIELRKERRAPAASDEEPKSFYKILQSRETSVSGGFMGSQHKYQVDSERRDDDRGDDDSRRKRRKEESSTGSSRRRNDSYKF